MGVSSFLVLFVSQQQIWREIFHLTTAELLYSSLSAFYEAPFLIPDGTCGREVVRHDRRIFADLDRARIEGSPIERICHFWLISSALFLCKDLIL